MHEHYFDRVIRDKFSDFEVSEVPSDWDKLEFLLDSNSIPWEENLKDKLIHHEVPFNISDWNLMHEELHGALDTSIASSLASYEVPFQSGDWELFEDKLNEPFYQAFRDRLVKHTISYRLRDWKAMWAQLKREQSPKNSYQQYWDLAVASILLLLILAGLGLSQLQRQQPKPIASNLENSIPNTSTESEIISGHFEEQRDGKNIQEGQLTTEHKSLTRQIVSNSTLSSSINDKSFTSNNNRLSSDDLNENNPSGELGNEDKPPSNLSPHMSYSELVSEPLESDIHLDEWYNDQSHIENEGSKIYLISNLVKKEFLLGYGGYYHPSNHVVSKLPHREKLQPEVRLGFLASTARSRAELSDDPLFGFMTGIRAELRLTKEWSIVSGAAYSEKQYMHQFFVYPERGPQRLNQLDANFKSIEIPILLRYTFPHNNELSLYMQGGLATMIMLEENYASVELSENISSRQAPKSSPSNRKFNTYVGNVQLAAGLEYGLNDQLSLQIEPYFQLGMHKMGREEKKLYSSGLTFSFIYLLKPAKARF